jgi:hypothetical protein
VTDFTIHISAYRGFPKKTSFNQQHLPEALFLHTLVSREEKAELLSEEPEVTPCRKESVPT